MTLPPLIVDKYRLLERLGEGGMGTVFRARDELLDREVAIKQLRPELVAESALAERFRAEAMVLARLSHPCIAALHGLERQDGRFYMVMEYLPGETLEALVARDGALPWRRAVAIASAVLDALEHAHTRGVVHRDIKPANIMVTPEGGVKVMDFGIARVMGRTRHTRAGHAVGTPAYMAPEQLRGEEVDGRADLYALGTVLYELLAGRVAFDADSDYRLMMMQLHDTPPPPGSVAAGVPKGLDRIVARAMAKKPADRYQDAAAMRVALAETTREADRAPGSRRAGAAERVPATAGVSAAARSVLGRVLAARPEWREEASSWVRDWRGWVTAGCLLAAAMFTIRAVSPRAADPGAGDSLTPPPASLVDGVQPVPGAMGAVTLPQDGAAGGIAVVGGAPPMSDGSLPGGMLPRGAVPAGSAPVGPAPVVGANSPTAPRTLGPSPTGTVEVASGKEGGRESARVSSPPAGGVREVAGRKGEGTAEPPAPVAANEASRREAAMSAAVGFLGRVGAGDAGAAAALTGGGTTGELSTLVRERRVSGAQPRELSVVLEGERARATADVELTWRTAFGGNRRSAVQIVMELRRQGAEWRVDAARVTGGELR